MWIKTLSQRIHSPTTLLIPLDKSFSKINLDLKRTVVKMYQVSSINFISIKHYIKIHQDKKKTYIQQNHMEE